MNASDNLYAILKHYEQGPGGGYAPYWYDDGAGNLTIGWGHLMRTDDRHLIGTPMTEAEADALLMKDAQHAINDVNEGLTRPVPQGVFDALCSFDFNVGRGRPTSLACKGRDGLLFLKNGHPSTLLRLTNAGKFAEAAEQFLLWTKSGGVVMHGLERRRKTERHLYLTGEVCFDY